jgi:hypothetical protein
MLLKILAKADDTRLLKATEGLCTGTYQIAITRHNAEELHGVVRNERGVEYHVAVWSGWAVCSCPDSRLRTTVCKHAVALALHAIRHPNPLREEAEQDRAAAGPARNRRLILSVMMGSGLGRLLFRLGRSLRLRMFVARRVADNGHEPGREVTKFTDDLKTS